ncbi:response regulator transcription factor [Thalassobaculum sp.]|uniref:response regulator transcription factor n=1 Tax=Thalassobaculum sp. TaxID=2022740 RepID=UPI003B5C43C3
MPTELTQTRRLTRVMDGVLASFDYEGLLALVVEPDDDNRALLCRALLDLGFPQPLDAHNAAAALYAAEELTPDLLILDSQLEGPDGTDGFELLQRIREDSTTLPDDIPVVLLAGAVNEFAVQESKRLEVDIVLTKPVPAKRLQNRVNALMMKRFTDRVTWGK